MEGTAAALKAGGSYQRHSGCGRKVPLTKVDESARKVDEGSRGCTKS